MDEYERGQVAAEAAELYERFFVPALFAPWPAEMLAAADVGPGHAVLDVACGTGVLARQAAQRLGDPTAVTGIDINDGMLAVARSIAPMINWQQGAAEALPFPDAAFDRVLSQFGLMFFEDQVAAIAEILRVARPGGKAVVAVWASLDETPGYAAVAEILNDLFGPQIARSIEAPYALGDTETLTALFASAGASDAQIRTVRGAARFASVEAWVYTDIKAWTLADQINDEDYRRLQREAPKRLAQFVQSDGSVMFNAPAHIVTVQT